MSRRGKIDHLVDSDFSTDITWGEAAKLLLDHMKRQGLKEFSQRHRGQYVKVLEKYIPTHTPISDLTTTRLQSILDTIREERQLSATTYNHYRQTVCLILDVVVRSGDLGANPAHGLVKMKERMPQIVPLSESQVRALLKQPDPTTFAGFRDFVMIKLPLDCGIRLREMLDLHVDQVDVHERRLRGVEGKNGRIEDIPLSKPMVEDLKEYLRIRGGSGNETLFINVDGGPLQRRTFQQRLHDYGEMAHISGVRVSPHTIRHTFAKQWVKNGGDIFSLQKMLRHSTMEMVRRYVNLFSDEVQQLHDQYSPLVNLDKRLPKEGRGA